MVMAEIRQELYLIADEMRGMASLSRRFAESVYERERADRMMELAVKVAALADQGSQGDVRAIFDTESWLRFSPAIGVEAAVFDADGAILLAQRKDSGQWAMPGGIAEIGQTPAESALRELWEEAGLRGRVSRLLGIFDGRFWGTRGKVHLVHPVFLMECEDLQPVPGIEMLDARFFSPDRLPDLHPGHDLRVPKVVELAQGSETFYDFADSNALALGMHQRPSSKPNVLAEDEIDPGSVIRLPHESRRDVDGN
jgi:8-oxo-dGTP pyrophosphatase MutT (NUDIX family)